MAVNEFGLDVHYFEKTVAREMAAIKHQTPNDLARVFARLSKTADAKVMREPEFTGDHYANLILIREKALQLAEACENKDDLHITKWALKCGRLVNEVKDLCKE
ncbi:hypothetical protein [Teredinibacter purpureus]|uniref:hypothetical protein n=1 Tax=Teredinibacter purpureus TaxID=2731756 RepID=UPI0005F7FFAE|nr:hypothetical protein [Teredinibacter purpureus]